MGGASGFRERKTGKVPNRAFCSGIGGAIQDCAFGLSHLATTTSLMEARVTTATRRLRRASVAGLATIATAVAVVGSAGSAGAAITGATLQTPTPVNVFPGQTAQALPNVTFTIPDANGAGWANGDFITLNLATGITPTPTTCNTGLSATRTASFTAKPTVTGLTNGTTAFTGFAVSQGSTAACSVQDQFTINFSAGAPADTNSTVFTISGLSVSLGVGVPTGNLDLATAVNGLSANLTPTGVKLATIGSNSVTVTPVVGAANGTTGVAISPIVVTDVTGGTLTTGVKFAAAAGDTFTTAGTLAAPAGVTVTGPSETLPAATLTYTIAAGTVPAGGKFTLTGAILSLANAASSHKVTVTTGAGLATAVGAPTEYATTAAEVRTFAGVDRYGTARALYHAAFAARTVAVITSGANYPDALSADVIAKKNTTGVLLTNPNALSQDAQEEHQ